MLLLITVQDLEKNSFTNFFRLYTPDYTWFFFDSSKKPTVSLKGVLDKFSAVKISYFAYIRLFGKISVARWFHRALLADQLFFKR